MIAAQQIQEHLFPERPPGLAGFDIAGASFPAEFTSGDYYDYIPLPEMCSAIVVGDVSGHGLGPALLMASTRSILRSIARTTGDVSEILTLANRFLREDTQPDHFVTLFLGRLDPHSRQFSYVSAGHPAAYVLDTSGKVKARLESTALPRHHARCRFSCRREPHTGARRSGDPPHGWHPRGDRPRRHAFW